MVPATLIERLRVLSNLARSLADQLREQQRAGEGLPGRLGEVFDTLPVPLDTFLYDDEYLGLASQGIQLSPIQYDYIKHFERIYHPETYSLLIDELGDEWIPPRMCHNIISEWGKGCVSPYTRVYDAETGQWRRIDSFTRPNLVAATYPSTGLVDSFEGTAAFKEGEGEMVRVTFVSGVHEDVYVGHKYLKRDKANYSSTPQWTEVRDLKVGDHIWSAGVLPEPTKLYTDAPDEEVELVGLYLGDGNLATPTTQFNICGGVDAPITKSRVRELYDTLQLPQRVSTPPNKNNKWYVYALQPFEGEVQSAREIMEKYGIDNKYARDKFIPEEFYSLSNRQLIILLSRLIDTDGSVYLKHGTQPVIDFASTSKQLTEGVMSLFLRLGVRGKIRDKKINYAYSDGIPRKAYVWEVTHAQQVVNASRVLTLLDKQEMLDVVAEVAKTKTAQKHTFGDLHWDRIKRIEPLGHGEYWTLTVDGPGSYISYGGIVNSNSGKDECARLAFSRVIDLLLNLKSPQAYFGIPGTNEIQMLNVAISAQQAHRAFFRPLRNLLVSSPRFHDQFRGEPPSDNAKSISFKKNLELISGHSQAESLEGLNLIAAIADEIAGFKSETELQQLSTGRQSNQTADYIMDMLRSSASTRFPENFKVGALSYPRYEDDAIVQLVERGRLDNEKYGDKSTWYVSGPYSTWEVNPRVNRQSPQIQSDYEDDPEYAAAKYECKPPKAVSRFLRSDTAIEQGFSREDAIPAVEIEYYWGLPPSLPNDHLGTPQEGWQVKFYFSPDLQPMEGAVYCLHGDLAIKQDSAGVAMAHVAQYRQAPHNHQIDFQPVVKVDFVTSFDADLGATLDGEPQPREVKIRWYRQLIFELLAKGFVISHVSFDQFNSVDLLQQMEELGIDSEIFSLDRTMKGYNELKNVLYDGRLDAPYDYITIEELKKLSYTGKKCDHLPGGSKDRADSVAGAVFWAVREGGSEGNNPTIVDLQWENSKNADARLAPELASIQMLPEEGFDLGLDYSDFSGDSGGGYW